MSATSLESFHVFDTDVLLFDGGHAICLHSTLESKILS